MRHAEQNPIAAFINHQGTIVLDGGLATELEARGCDLDDALWSAKMLLEAPEEIRQVHVDFLAAGADCITTSTYQASLVGFRARGLSGEEAVDLIRCSVNLAIEARELFWAERDNRRFRLPDGARQQRLLPLVAASVGPYGAFLADGSEYTGNYAVSDETLYDFHRARWEILAESPADLLACETIPSRREAEVLLDLLRRTPGRWAWMSFSCRDEDRLCDGSRVFDMARACDALPRVAGVGINCTSPGLIPALIAEVRRGTTKPVIVYPNSGERYDSKQKVWRGSLQPIRWDRVCLEWTRLGATGVGGCCRVGPKDIATIRGGLLASSGA